MVILISGVVGEGHLREDLHGQGMGGGVHLRQGGLVGGSQAVQQHRAHLLPVPQPGQAGQAPGGRRPVLQSRRAWE